MKQITTFKSIRPVTVKHERGTDKIQAQGTVIKIEGNRVYLKGPTYDFSISLKDFEQFNIVSK